jgi:hypothetical protein
MRGYRVTELPIDYRERRGETTLDPISGGAAIAASILRVTLEERLDLGATGAGTRTESMD